MMDKKKILLVDDEETTGFIFSKKLTKQGFDVALLTDGEKCLNYLDDHKPDIILLDVVMPGISGITVLSQIRKSFQQIELPVIMVTAQGETEDVSLALKKGANDYLVKPVNLEIALARIRTQLHMKAYYQDSLGKKQLETLNAMITTYNHEINNPLCIALGCVELLSRKIASQGSDHGEKFTDNKNQEYLYKIQKSLERVGDIVKKIERTTEQELCLENYAGSTKLINLK